MPSDRHEKSSRKHGRSRSRSPPSVQPPHRSDRPVKRERAAASPESSSSSRRHPGHRHTDARRDERKSRDADQERGYPSVASRQPERAQQRLEEDRRRDRRERPSRFDMARVKVEPKSEDEEDRRRPQRAAGGHGDNRRQGGGQGGGDPAPADAPPASRPDFGLSGKLTEDANIFNGVVVKYSEPVEARKPNKKWRLYSFKGEQQLPMLPIHRQSAYLLGRERRVADIPIDHPSCSKQHAALQYRSLPYRKEDGTTGRRIRPYIIDLESANGTFINNNRIEAKRYVELMEKDVIKFGFSSREYVILHEGSSTTVDDESDAALADSSPEPT